MRVRLAGPILASVALVLSALSASAQKNRGLELGADAALYHNSYSSSSNAKIDGVTGFSFPLQGIRVAFPTDGPFEFEVAGSLTTYNSGETSVTSFTGDVGLLIEMSHDPKQSQWYARPALGWVLGSGVSGRATVGAGLGVRMPLTDRISARYEARYTYYSAVRDVSINVFALRAGISVFTR